MSDTQAAMTFYAAVLLCGASLKDASSRESAKLHGIPSAVDVRRFFSLDSL